MASTYGISNMYRQMSTYRLMNTMTAQMQKKGSLGTTSNLGSVQAFPTFRLPQYQSGLSADSLSFVKQYQMKMSAMGDAAKEVMKATGDDLKVTSSDTTVADVSAQGKLAESASYTVNVSQLATAQTNQSQAMTTTGHDFKGDLTLQTASGSFQFQADAAASDNLKAMNSLVNQINKAQTDVSASVQIGEDGKASLALTSTKTGEKAQFLASGSLSDATGLSNTVQQAQNAIYSIQKKGSILPAKEHTSQSNTIDVDSGARIQAQLKNTGSTTVDVSPDYNKKADATQDMVNSFNSLLTLLRDNSSRGTGVSKQIQSMVLPPTSTKSMESIGITTNKDGTLRFDRTAFLKSSSERPEMTQEILSGSFGVANGMYLDSQHGIRQSARSLLSADIQETKLQAVYNNLLAQTMMYSRNGMNNLSNYLQAGMIFNMLA